MAASKSLLRSLATATRSARLLPPSSILRPSTSISQSALIRPAYATRFNRSNVPSLYPRRYNSNYTTRPPNPLTDSKPLTPEDQEALKQRLEQEPQYQITFTCRPCSHRSTHRMSKHGYHRGTVLITCPNCKNRHVISDHLKVFRDTKGTLEDILSEQGKKIIKGTLEGDMEFWEDGTVRKSDVSESEPAQPPLKSVEEEMKSAQQEGDQMLDDEEDLAAWEEDAKKNKAAKMGEKSGKDQPKL
ncbi:hypothetical protein AJ80_04090 [Polytolypa hystricis UAMH7299]|uniref:DNL-type domain-containing protein n=1 Tax=Polytolypa hystricis (strain UAMH7299) TaxID=1447883 RepID=A0A2B7YD80_POLH7|nr:hypothetical protein AJ80_04090 [Polytolypa hystricis UAMH7299]